MSFNKDKVMDAARKFVDKGQIDKAIKEYLRIVKEDPKDVRVWLKIGDLYAKQGAKQEASETYLKVAKYYEAEGFAQKAVAVYKQIIKLDPRMIDVNLRLAELYRNSGLASEAMQHYEAVAGHFHREGNTKEALAAVRKVVEIDPENVASRIKLAELYSKENMTVEAVDEFTQACERLRSLNRPDDFIKVAERLLWHKPDNQALNRELAALYLARKDPRRALQKLQAAFKADARDIETLSLLARAFFELDQKAKTVSVLKELAKIHLDTKARDAAGEVYRKILEFVPSDAEALAFLGKAAPKAAPTPQPAAAAPVAARVPEPPRPAPAVTGTGPSSLPPRPAPAPRPTAASPAASQRAPAFNFTSELPVAKGVRGTGAMPLVNDGGGFATPEFEIVEEADYTSDLSDGRDARGYSAQDVQAEAHAPEIAKMLMETDVYIKYALYPKAIDHLKRIFALDANNLEARERLKDVFRAQGRDADAVAELLRMAQHTATSDARRAEEYVRELLELDGTNQAALDLVRRHRLRVGRSSYDTSPLDGGAISEVGIAARGDSIDDFDPHDLIGGAQGSPAPGRPPGPPIEADFELEDAEFQEIPSDAFELESDERPNSLGAAVDAQLDDAALGDDIDDEVAAEVANYTAEEFAEDLPFDPNEAKAFDEGVKAERMVLSKAGGYAPPPMESDEFELGQLGAATPGFQLDDYNGFAREPVTSTATDAPPLDARDTSMDMAGSSGSLEDDLEEAEFFVGQEMLEEAAEVLRGLLGRYPNHPLVLAKLQEVEGNRARAGEAMADPAQELYQSVRGGDVGAFEHELDSLDAAALTSEDDSDDDAGMSGRRKATNVVLENPVDDGDAATHYDLGMAYKDMGLYDDAIGAFEKALRARSKEVQARLMIGLCQREQGSAAEAVNQFKQALHAAALSELERQSLYYEIGVTYELLRDQAEALYYLEMVVKRDPNFADAAQRVQKLRTTARR